MKLLGIDTATEACSVALTGVGDTILERYKIEPKGHSNLVLPMIDDLLSDSGISHNDLDAIAVDTGPGSFTGIRIGIGIAQGLSFGLKLPLIGISSLMVLAEGSEPTVSAVLPAIDARMGEVYWGRLVRDQETVEGWAWRSRPCVTKPSLLPVLENDEIGVGSGWEKYLEVIETNTMAEIKTGVFPRAIWLVTIAARAIVSDFNFGSSAIPQYIRNNIVD